MNLLCNATISPAKPGALSPGRIAPVAPGARTHLAESVAQSLAFDLPQSLADIYTGKGLGFIKPDCGGRDVFVHISAVEKAGHTSLSEGAKISYELLITRSARQWRLPPLRLQARTLTAGGLRSRHGNESGRLNGRPYC